MPAKNYKDWLTADKVMVIIKRVTFLKHGAYIVTDYVSSRPTFNLLTENRYKVKIFELTMY